MITPVERKKTLKLVSADDQTPNNTPSQTPLMKLRRSDSMTGLSSLQKGVSELESLYKEQSTALIASLEQLELQSKLIEEYRELLQEHEEIISRIIDG